MAPERKKKRKQAEREEAQLRLKDHTDVNDECEQPPGNLSWSPGRACVREPSGKRDHLKSSQDQ